MSDDGSFEKFFRDTYLWLVDRLLRRFSISREKAEDTAQEAFSRVFPKWRTIRGTTIGQRRKYLLTAARNVYLNSLREPRWIEMAFDESSDPPEGRHLQPTLGSPPPSAEDRLLEAEKRRRRRAWLANAIDRLPMRQRDVTLLRMHGRTYKEIARLLATSEDAVKSALRDARESLRVLLREEENERRSERPENDDDHQD